MADQFGSDRASPEATNKLPSASLSENVFRNLISLVPDNTQQQNKSGLTKESQYIDFSQFPIEPNKPSQNSVESNGEGEANSERKEKPEDLESKRVEEQARRLADLIETPGERGRTMFTSGSGRDEVKGIYESQVGLAGVEKLNNALNQELERRGSSYRIDMTVGRERALFEKDGVTEEGKTSYPAMHLTQNGREKERLISMNVEPPHHKDWKWVDRLEFEFPKSRYTHGENK